MVDDVMLWMMLLLMRTGMANAVMKALMALLMTWPAMLTMMGGVIELRLRWWCR